MSKIFEFKQEIEEISIEYEIHPPITNSQFELLAAEDLEADENYIDELLETNLQEIQKLDSKINQLTCDADKIDFIVSACSGVFAGIVDVVFVRSFNFKEAEKSVESAFNKFVEEGAKKDKTNKKIKEYISGKKEKGKTISEEEIRKIKERIEHEFENAPDKRTKSIRWFEKKYKIPSDRQEVWKKPGIKITEKSHHLDDLAHHPTVVGLMASLLTQFTPSHIALFQNEDGRVIKFDIETNELIGKSLREKLICGVVNWIGHLISDMAGSNKSSQKGNKGMGLPGPLLSTLKEFSMLPFVKDKRLPKLVNDLFTDDKVLGGARLDLRSELALGQELVKQAIPVFLNEILVRSFYFVRHLIEEGKGAKNISDINWSKVLPIKNRTIVRMLTVSFGAMETIDISEAAIQGAIEAIKYGKAGAEMGSIGGPMGMAAGAAAGAMAVFGKTFVMHINFVGIGRTTVAVAVDTGMGFEREKVRSQRMELYAQRIQLTSVKLFYKDAEMWIAAEDAEKTINEAYEMMEKVEKAYLEEVDEIRSSIKAIECIADKAEEKNPGLKNSMLDTLKWGI